MTRREWLTMLVALLLPTYKCRKSEVALYSKIVSGDWVLTGESVELNSDFETVVERKFKHKNCRCQLTWVNTEDSNTMSIKGI